MKYLSLICCMLIFSFAAYAQDVPVEVTEVPAWLSDVLVWVSAIPKVGPIFVEVVKWLGVIASVFTALSICIQAILAVPMIMAKWAGAHEFSEKVKALNDKIQPYLKYLSIFNVQKK